MYLLDDLKGTLQHPDTLLCSPSTDSTEQYVSIKTLCIKLIHCFLQYILFV